MVMLFLKLPAKLRKAFSDTKVIHRLLSLFLSAQDLSLKEQSIWSLAALAVDGDCFVICIVVVVDDDDFCFHLQVLTNVINVINVKIISWLESNQEEIVLLGGVGQMVNALHQRDLQEAAAWCLSRLSLNG